MTGTCHRNRPNESWPATLARSPARRPGSRIGGRKPRRCCRSSFLAHRPRAGAGRHRSAGVGQEHSVRRHRLGELRAQGKTVAIVAVDPSSPYTGGAIAGRPHPHAAASCRSAGFHPLHGHARMAGRAGARHQETALLLDAAGFDVVIVETVGVGQDEVEIARLAEVTAGGADAGRGRRCAGDQSGYYGDRRRVRHQ